MPLFSFFQAHAATIVESNGAADISQLVVVMSNFLGIATGLAGMIAVVVIIIGGFKYIIAHGDPKGIAAARSTIIWAIVGLFFLILAYLILSLIEEITGVKVTRFGLPTSPP